jgi:hypothetical protein
MTKQKIIINITLPHVNFLFDHMLLKSFIHINLLSINIKHGKLIKFLI